MSIDALDAAKVRRAVDLYLELAFPTGSSPRPTLPPSCSEEGRDLAGMLEGFEQRPEHQRGSLKHFALRLGNHLYPFMKLVVLQHLLSDDLFLAVDTHDHLDVDPTAPDFSRWIEVRGLNRELKDRIESAWRDEGLPTSAELADRCEALPPLPSDGRCRGQILVVDDERHFARSVSALMRRRGYGVSAVHSGEEVLEALSEGELPDLVLLDYEMPGIDGEEVLRRLRADPRTEALPVLLATFRDIDLARMPTHSTYLRKPYDREVLFRLIGQMLGPEEPGGA